MKPDDELEFINVVEHGGSSRSSGKGGAINGGGGGSGTAAVGYDTSSAQAGQLGFIRQSKHPGAAFFHYLFKALAVFVYVFGGIISSNFVFVCVVCILLLAFDFWTVKNISGRLMVRFLVCLGKMLEDWSGLLAEFIRGMEFTPALSALLPIPSHCVRASLLGFRGSRFVPFLRSGKLFSSNLRLAACAPVSLCLPASSFSHFSFLPKKVGLRWWSTVKEDGTTEWKFESLENLGEVNPADSKLFWLGLYASPVVWSALFFVGLLKFNVQWLVIVIVALTLNVANIVGYTKCSNDAKQKVRNLMHEGVSRGAMAALGNEGMRSMLFSLFMGGGGSSSGGNGGGATARPGSMAEV
ncbi:unnamed protein product [Phaeothamnion confervicola]